MITLPSPRRSPLFLFAALVVLSLSVRAIDETPRPEPNDLSTWTWNDPTPIPGVTHGEIRSESMDRIMGYNIYLPPSYASETRKRYPVVYWLHGAYGRENDVGLAMIAKSEIEAGALGEVIYVAPNSGQFSGYRDWPDENVKAETWIIAELIPTIDQRYRTIASKKGRALAGYSMGGMGSIRLGFKYPDLFCAIASCSGMPRMLERGADARREDNAYHWAETNQEKLKDGKMPLYLTMGDSERYFAAFPPFVAKLHELDIKFHAEVFPNLGHDLGTTFELAGKDLVHFLASAYQPANAE